MAFHAPLVQDFHDRICHEQTFPMDRLHTVLTEQQITEILLRELLDRQERTKFELNVRMEKS